MYREIYADLSSSGSDPIFVVRLRECLFTLEGPRK